MPRYKITIEYDGSNYAGWQKQPDEKTIQEVIENALKKAFRNNIEIFASGRTDSGVHALGQVAHFDFDKKLSEFAMMMAINQNINFDEEVIITKCQIVSDDFHSRFGACERFYQYKILNRRARPILEKNRVWHVPQDLDIKKMQEASKYLLGKHDFSSFRDSECQTRSPIRTINKIEIEKINDLIIFEISAKSFLHHMVRNIIGTLYLAGRYKIKPEEIKDILKAKDRTVSGPNAPARGLYFLKVDYL